MKAISIISCALAIFVATGFGSTIFSDRNGRPGCNSTEELAVRVFRNFWDPTVYWVCEELNEPGVKRRCPPQTGFLDSQKDCVPWNEWIWEEPIPPLSEADY